MRKTNEDTEFCKLVWTLYFRQTGLAKRHGSTAQSAL